MDPFCRELSPSARSLVGLCTGQILYFDDACIESWSVNMWHAMSACSVVSQNTGDCVQNESVGDVRTSSSSQAVTHSNQQHRVADEDKASQQQQDSHSEDSYSTDFSSDSSSDDDHKTHQPQDHEPQTNELAQRTSSSDRPAKTRPHTSSETGSRPQSGRSSTMKTTEKSARIIPTAVMQGFGMSEQLPTRSPARISSAARQRAEQTNAGHTDISGQNDEHGSGSGSPTGLVSSTRPVHNYHLKYSDNDDVRRWLHSKDVLCRRERKERRRLERARRQQVEERKQEKERRRKESDVMVQRWMEQKNTEMRMLNKRQQQQPKTLEHPQQTTPANDELKNPHPNHQRGKKSSVGIQAVDHHGKNTLTVKDDRSKVPLFTPPEKFETFPGTRTWKKSGKKTPEVERCKTASRDRSRVARTAVLSTVDDSKMDLVKDHSKSPLQSVPHPSVKVPTRDQRCASARGGRRWTDTGQSLRTQGRRPRSGIGTRLEPQGADHLDPVTELDSTVASKYTTPGVEVTVLKKTLWKDSPASSTVPNVSSEFEDGKTTVRDPDITGGRDWDHTGRTSVDQKIITQEDDTHLGQQITNKKKKYMKKQSTSCDSQSNIQEQDHGVEVPEDQKSPEASEDQTGLGPRMHSSRDLMTIIKNESRPVTAHSRRRASRYSMEQQECKMAGEDERAVPSEKEEKDEECSHEDDEHQIEKTDVGCISDEQSRSGSTNTDVIAVDEVANDVVLP